MRITPIILGRGSAGKAIAKSLAMLNIVQPELSIEPAIWLERDSNLIEERKKYDHPLLVVANPHGLHAKTIIDADKAQFEAILCEKPACVTYEQLQSLRAVKTPVALLHVYRQMWGIQTLKKMVEDNQFGEIISIEGKYWQASTAARALSNLNPQKGWKDDPQLAGEFDAFLDIGSHWIDAASFLLGVTPKRIEGWKTNANSSSSHRDSHVQLMLEFSNSSRGLCSISKTVHGATNDFQITIIGSKLAATWSFLTPDELFIGEGLDRKVIIRKTTDLGSRQWAFHGVGWLEGYIEIASQLVSEVYYKRASSYPNLKDNLSVLEAMFKTRWM